VNCAWFTAKPLPTDSHVFRRHSPCYCISCRRSRWCSWDRSMIDAALTGTHTCELTAPVDKPCSMPYTRQNIQERPRRYINKMQIPLGLSTRYKWQWCSTGRRPDLEWAYHISESAYSIVFSPRPFTSSELDFGLGVWESTSDARCGMQPEET